MNWFLRATLIVLMGLWLTGCSSDNDETNTVPTPTDPTINDTTDINPPGWTPDTRLPDLTNAIPVNLFNTTNYQPLIDLAGLIDLPLVGDPLVKMNLQRLSTANEITGTILFSFEDQYGFWGAQLNSFAGTSFLTTNSLDAIFADDEFVLRAIGAVSGDTLTGTLYYRIRQSDEEQCLPVVVSCNVVQLTGWNRIEVPGLGLQWVWFPNTSTGQTSTDGWYYLYINNFGWQWVQLPDDGCDDTAIDTATPCQVYMNTSLSAVEELGSFTNTNLLNWVSN